MGFGAFYMLRHLCSTIHKRDAVFIVAYPSGGFNDAMA